MTAIYCAAQWNQCEAIDLLLELKASVNDQEREAGQPAAGGAAPRTLIETGLAVGGAALSVFWRRGRHDADKERLDDEKQGEEGGVKDAAKEDETSATSAITGAAEGEPKEALKTAVAPPSAQRSDSVSSVASDGQPVHDDGETPMHIAGQCQATTTLRLPFGTRW